MDEFTDRSNPILKNGTATVLRAREMNPFPGNWLLATENGDIMYTGLGVMPVRSVVSASFTRRGEHPDSVWKGILTSSDMPYVVNPDKGYLVSCNNFIGSSRMKHGISLQRTFTGRKSRISELLEELIADKDRKVNVRSLQKVQLDVLDIQARESLSDMVTGVKTVLESKDGLIDDQTKLIAERGLQYLKGWDYKHDFKAKGAPIMEVWEYMLATYMHETTIEDVRLRRGIYGFPAGESFAFL